VSRGRKPLENESTYVYLKGRKSGQKCSFTIRNVTPEELRPFIEKAGEELSGKSNPDAGAEADDSEPEPAVAA
jgi:hypothetical protein